MVFRFLTVNSMRLMRVGKYQCHFYSQPVSRQKSITQDQRPKQAPFSLSFKEYRKIRKGMKWRDMGVGLLGGCASMFLFTNVFMQLNPNLFTMSAEEIKPIFGMDPILVLGGGGMSSMLIGFLTFYHGYSALWRLFYPSLAKEVAKRDQDFMGRLAIYRFKGMTQQSWEDDYHGEKILNLSDYRQWIRKQHQKKLAANKVV